MASTSGRLPRWRAKMHAARTMIVMARYLENWQDVWSVYRRAGAVPPLRFRQGFTLNYGPGDDPILLLHEVFGARMYTRAGRPTDGVALDVGANIGAVALDWASRAPALRVHAYEPAPVARARLEANVAASGFADRITVFPEGLAATAGTVTLHVSEFTVLSSLYALPSSIPPGTDQRVPVITLRDAVRRAGGAVRLLKLDVEGAEGDILGAADRETLRAMERVVLEYHDHLVPGVLERCRRALTDAGFSCRIRPTSALQGMLDAQRIDAMVAQ